MTEAPILLVIAGPNGAGKSTFYDHFISPRRAGYSVILVFIGLECAELLGTSRFRGYPDIH